MSNLQDLANPYDFANPVSDGELFVGRTDELSEINYYLGQALRAKRPTNIAIIGARASGKTSLLNVTEQYAQKLGLLTVRIDLDEGDAANQWAFFFKIFDTLFSAACKAGAFGGLHSKTFDTYADMTCSLSVPEDKTFCPFLFPIQYAKAISGNNLLGHVPDYSFRQDLSTIQTEIKRQVVLLFDEGNVLSKSRTHLQKLRNIFMNTQGYMLFLTGTDDMFPLMDEVFSPIIRQFKKITLRQFVDEEDTESLIRKYLDTVGVDADDIFSFGNSNNLEDIHDLTGGRPYEIQLVCHTLFRRVQQRRAARMSLDLGAIEEVRQQLESSQNLAGRPILSKIKALDSEMLEALAAFSPYVGNASLEQVIALEHTLGARKWSRDNLASKFACLKAEGILDQSGKGVLVFNGDDFDKIYTKYFSREKEAKSTVQFLELPYTTYATLRLDAFVEAVVPVRALRSFPPSPRATNIELLADAMGNPNGPADVFVETPLAILRSIYGLLFDHQGFTEVSLVDCRISLAGAELQTLYKPRKRDNSDALQGCLELLGTVGNRVEEIGGNSFAQLVTIRVPPLTDIQKQIATSGNRKLGELIAETHVRSVVQAYFTQRITTPIQRHAAAAVEMAGFLSPTSLNNLGYFFMAQSELEKAARLFQASVDAHRKAKSSHVLPTFNLAVVQIRSGNLELAASTLRKAAEAREETDEDIACLFVPRRIESRLEVVEIKEQPKLSLEISAAMEALAGLRSGDDL